MKTHRVRLSLLLVVLFLLTASTSFAQSTEFTYQGRLLSGGLPANGSHDFEFRLFSDPDGNTQAGTAITLTSVNVNNGVFSVRLDFGNQFPGANRYLEIRVKESGQAFFTVLTPRQAITSAPYAIKSLSSESAGNSTNAAQLGGVEAGQYVMTGDSRLSDDRNPLANSPNYVQNTTSQQLSANFNISGTGTANIFNVATSYNIGGNRVINTGGTNNIYVGVGASSLLPNAGSNNSFLGTDAGRQNSGSNNSFVGFASGTANFVNTDNSFFGAFTGSVNNLTNATAIGAHAHVNQSNSLVLGSISGINGATANTFVGIGTTAPTAKLTVSGSGAFNGSGAARFDLFNSLANVGFLQHVTDAGLWQLATNDGSTKMVVTSAGNVGIGTNAPMAKLTVAGSGAFNGSGAARFDLFNSLANVGFLQHVTDAGLWQLATGDGATKMVVTSAGNVGIGTTSPSALFQVRTNNNNILLGNPGCVSGFVGIGFGTSLSGCTNYSLVGNGTDTIINRPTGGTLYVREGNTTQMFISPGGAITIPGNLTVSGTFNANLPSNNPGYIQNTTVQQTSSNFNISGNGTAGGNLSGSNVYATSRIGIGTTSPASRLGIVGSGVYNATNAARFDLFNTTANLGYLQHITNDGSWQLATTNGETRMLVDSLGNVSISKGVVISGKLIVANYGSNGSTTICRNASGELSFCSSSIRYKTNINPFRSGLNLVKRLRPVTFNWKADNTLDVGLVAEDVARAEPLLVTLNDKGEIEGVKYDRVGVVLVNAVQEQQVQIDTQQKQLDEQKEIIKRQGEKLNSQRAELNALRKIVCSQNPEADLCQPKD